MENFFSRYKNPLVLMLVLFIQVVGLATQVKRAESAKNAAGAGSGGGPRLIRVWTVSIITPFEKAFTSTGHFFRGTWHNYIDLHDARKENRDLQEQLSRMKMEQVRLREESAATARLQNLLDFKQRYIGQTVAAQVIGTSGADQSRVIYIDKGSHSGIKVDMPVITPDGIVGKVKEVFKFTSQVLLVNDHDSGAGVVLQNSRLQGVLSGTPQGQLVVTRVMSDEKIDIGERVVTTGHDGIYPKGVPVGVVTKSVPDVENDPFLRITIKPAANLDKLEEVLVVTSIAEESPSSGTGPQRAADILAQRLPSAKQEDKPGDQGATATPTPAASPAVTPRPKPVAPPQGTGTPGTGAPATATPRTAVPVTKPQGTAATGTATPATSGTGAPGTAASATASPAIKKSPDQKKPVGTGTPTGTPVPGSTPKAPSATGSPSPNSTTSKTGATSTKGTAPSANRAGAKLSGASTKVGEAGTKSGAAAEKKKGPPKPKATPTPAATDAAPAETPETKKPEPDATPTPPPTGESLLP